MATHAAALRPSRSAPLANEFRRIYVWEFPVRVTHWVNALAITVLAVTGYLIGDPLTFWPTAGVEPSGQYWFGWIRFEHFASAYVLLFALVFRFYWGFVGYRFARWANFIPLTKAQFLELKDTLFVDILEIKREGKIAIGHNFMAAASYLGLFAVTIFMVITGFGLYAAMSDSWIPWLFSWIVPLMGSDQAVRRWHHIFMWAFVVFTVIHMYLAVFHDFVEGRGEISSMVGGWKFDRSDRPRK
ncbi:MAG TPA: Ni/Fe-hydrogenase, b-type cytochrome subunit [Pyrinomonadaceae bacterium]|nr:Ni/Fe-hydrogenase, b-type cytochrome subunit [Pyrinomonadaceae bacterium]